MSTKKYMIRATCFGYNDEVFYASGKKINSVYADEASARKALNDLIVEYTRDVLLSDVAGLFDASDELIASVNQLVKDKTGRDFDVYEHDYLPPKMTDNDVIEFHNMVEIDAYQLVEFEEDAKLYAIWKLEQGEYEMFYEEYFEGVIIADTKEELFDRMGGMLYENDERKTIEGTLDELSESPAVLQSLIESTKKINYNEEKQQLNLKKATPREFNAVNALLKKPFYEIKALTIEEAQKLEEELTHYGY